MPFLQSLESKLLAKLSVFFAIYEGPSNTREKLIPKLKNLVKTHSLDMEIKELISTVIG